jgi:beta-glucosidase
MRRLLRLLALGVSLAATAAAQAQPAARGDVCHATIDPATAPRDAIPAPLAGDDWRLHNEALIGRLAMTQIRNPDLVFVGDSITEGWDPGLFQHFFGAYTALNLGVSSDQTQSTMWRLGQGEWKNLRPRVIVVLIGTNNLTQNSQPPDVATGIGQLVQLLLRLSPESRILLVGLLPRGQFASEEQRHVVERVNDRIRQCADGSRIDYLDTWPVILDHNGTMSFEISPDTLHLSPVGYALFGSVLKPAVARLMKAQR